MKYSNQTKYQFHPFSLIYFSILILFNKFTFIFLQYLISFIHEISHVICAKCLHIKVEKVCIHPLGFFAQMDTLDYCPRWKQILVLLLGPSSVIITYALLKFCCSFNLISIYTYQYGIKINFIIFFFNLIPCLPLDGGKIMMIILASFFSELKARIINLSISLICLILMTGFLFSLYDLMMFIFLFFNLGLSLINLQKDYQTFLIERRLIGKFSKIRINKKKEIFRYNDNYYLIDNQIYHEKEMFDLKVK